MVTLIGMGSGKWEALSAQAQQAVRSAGLVFGAKRLLAGLPADSMARQFALYQPLTFWKHWHKTPGRMLPCFTAAIPDFTPVRPVCSRPCGAGHPRAGVSGRFQHPAAFSGAGPTVAGLEAGLGPWLCLRPGGRVHDEPFGVLPHRRH